MKVTVRGLEIEVQSFDELDELIRRYSGVEASVNVATPATPAKTAAAEVATTKARLPSQNKREAMLKMYKGLRATIHKDVIRVLASKRGRGVDTDEVRKDLGLHEGFKMSGFTAMVRKRAPSYGLNPDEILAVEFRGTVAGQRLYLYALGPEMLSVLEEEGLMNQGKPPRDGGK